MFPDAARYAGVSHATDLTMHVSSSMSAPAAAPVTCGPVKVVGACHNAWVPAWVRVQVGSSLKLLMVAEGEAHMYPR